MTQEEKDLLLKDLCARLPYGIKCEHMNWDIKAQDYVTMISVLYGITHDAPIFKYINNEEIFICESEFGIDYIKPYLFPLSNITEEQRNIISNKIKEIQINNPPFGKIHKSGTDNLLNNITLCAQWLINYYIENHFDYNGLIEKKLALDATNLNIY